MDDNTNGVHKIPGNGDGSSKEVIFLHGELDLWVLEAKSLPNMDLASERIRQCFTMFGNCSYPFGKRSPKVHSGKHSIITSDPYVSVCLAGATVAQTRVIANCENPLWDEHFCVPVAHPATEIEFHVKDNDVLGAEHIGVVEISIDKIISGNKINDWFPIIGHHVECLNPFPKLHISIQFRPVRDNPLYNAGVGAGPEYIGVPNTYFPLRRGGNVTLYQDAHVPEKMLPEILLDGGTCYEQNGCWEDICHAILEAHNLIYIIGWSIYHRVKLVREPTKPLPAGGDLSLGELLKYKSQEGVRVVLLIWDDKTSHDNFLLKTEGVMQTHDEETKKFFRHSSVHCVLCPRYASNKLSIFKQQPNANGPRQPWHDLHCKIDGPAAYDILTNFEQRWKKAKWRDFRLKKITSWHDDALIKVDRISWILTPSTGPIGDQNVCVSNEEDPENWHVQVFRSIDSGSVKGFPKGIVEAEAQNLMGGKNLKVDKSIHTAYVKAIRSAQHFIYIENQYFVGSSFFWPSYKNAGADNLVPMELALKISEKIKANERFSVYVVIPMWPEGVPTSAAVQEILFWQGQTMTMMYHMVAQAIEKAGLSDKYHPQDYLNFFCLGKREPSSTPPSSESSSHTNQPHENCASVCCFPTMASAQKFRRFMIYVHAKGMIVDDEYVLMGSANINQRSLDGSRDTEIAMGAYQPKHTWAAKNSHPNGKVYGYRMSLWAEHLGEVEESFYEPQSLKCLRRVNEIAKRNWKAYVAEEEKKMMGHLMQYPVQISRDGKVSSLNDYDSFPDVGGKVLGTPTTLPDALTT
ncbi:hypothetical protein UlMin_032600 [Ulmus minor]